MENASSLLQATLSRVIHARSPWEVLGVSRDCSVSEARRAYKRVRAGRQEGKKAAWRMMHA